MKKYRKELFFLVGIVISLMIIIYLGSNEIEKKDGNDNYQYAILVDGVQTTKFPAKGLYTVDVDCQNAVGKWSYDDWKLIIKSIESEEKIYCNIDFESINKKYLNEYVIGLSGTTQGNGEIIHETATFPVWNDTTLLTQSDYDAGTTEMYTESTSSEGLFTFDGTNWSSVNSLLTEERDHIFKFYPSTAGDYKVCMQLTSGGTIDEGCNMEAGVNGSTSSSLYADNDGIPNDACVYVGRVDAGDYIDVHFYVERDTTSLDNTTWSEASFNISKINSTQTVDAGYRYAGGDPNNYVFFNNELWRIVGVFDENSHGISGLDLVKIVRTEFLGNYGCSNYDNGYANSSIYNLLNQAYYNAANVNGSSDCVVFGGYLSRSWNPVWGWHVVQSDAKCDYSSVGISNNYRNYIEDVTWYLGGPDNGAIESIYGVERSDLVHYNYDTSINGKVGLLYDSDIRYSFLPISCRDDVSLAGCSGWLPIATINNPVATLAASSTSANCMGGGTGMAGSIYPSVYLNENVYVLDGDGSIDDPYIIAMD